MNSFVHITAWWMRNLGIVEFEEAVLAGTYAYLQAVQDGYVSGDVISPEAKRFVRREMLRAAGRSPVFNSLKDYGYENGSMLNRGPRKPFRKRDTYTAYRERNRTKGVCTICGGQRDSERLLCRVCRKKRSAIAKRSREKLKTKRAGFYVPLSIDPAAR